MPQLSVLTKTSRRENSQVWISQQHVIRDLPTRGRSGDISHHTPLSHKTWWVYPPYSVWSSSCWSFVFAGPHRSDLLNIKAVHVHLTYEDSTVRGGPFSISNLFLYRILSLCCLYFAICLFLTPLVLTDHSTSPHASSYEAMVVQFGYRIGNIDVVDTGRLVCNVINTILNFVAAAAITEIA